MTGPLVYIVEVPTPYRNAELDRAAQQLGPAALHAVFVRPTADGCFDYHLPQVCSHRVIGPPAQTQGLSLADLPAQLDAWNPHAVILGGYHQAPVRAALAWCRRQRRPFCFRSDTNVHADQLKGWPRRLLRHVRLGRWVKHAHRILLTGRYNRDFWTRYGMVEEQAGWWPQWIDYAHFEQAAMWRTTRREELRRQYDLPGEVTLLHVGRLVERKRVDLLCETLLRCGPQVGLAVAGSGPCEAELRQRYQAALGPRLRFLGAVAPEKLPEMYAAADVLAVASGATEPWGMVLNEATAAGLPIVCHERVGAAGDLLIDDGNGIALCDDGLSAWVAAVERLAGNAALRRRMGEQSSAVAARWKELSDPGECLAKLRDEPAEYRE